MHMIDKVRERRDEILRIARNNKISEVLLFGSCARREECADSDLDFLVTFEQNASLLDQVHMRDDLSALFGRPIDIVSRRGLSPYVGPRILAEAVAI